MEFVILVIVLVAFNMAALQWGVNSSDSIDSPEWEWRQRWYGFH